MEACLRLNLNDFYQVLDFLSRYTANSTGPYKYIFFNYFIFCPVRTSVYLQ